MAQNRKTQRKFRKNNKSLRVKHKGGGAPKMNHDQLDAALLNSSTPWYGKSVFSPVDDKGVPLVCSSKSKETEDYAECEQDKYNQYNERLIYLEGIIKQEVDARQKDRGGDRAKFSDEQIVKIMEEMKIIDGQKRERVAKGAQDSVIQIAEATKSNNPTFTDEQYRAEQERKENMREFSKVQRRRNAKKAQEMKDKRIDESKAKRGEEPAWLEEKEIEQLVKEDSVLNRGWWGMKSAPSTTQTTTTTTTASAPQDENERYLGVAHKVINKSLAKYQNLINNRAKDIYGTLHKEIKRLEKEIEKMKPEQTKLNEDYEGAKKKALKDIYEIDYKDIDRKNGNLFTADAQREEARAVWEAPRTGSTQWESINKRKILKERLKSALKPYCEDYIPTNNKTKIGEGKGRQLKYQILSMEFSDTELYKTLQFSAGQNTNQQYIRYEAEWEKLQFRVAGMTDEDVSAEVRGKENIPGLFTDFKLRGRDEEKFFTKVIGDDNTLRGGKRKTRRRLKKRHTRKIKRKH